jgi:serine/threonine protein kinase
MSGIFLAKTTSVAGFQKPLVIKKLLPEYASRPRYVRRFINEARTLVRLNQSNIVQIMDMGVINGEYYIAMEYIEGRNMAHVLSKAAKAGKLPSLEFGLYAILELAKGLSYAHRKRGAGGESLVLVHQDINSFNVMVSYEGEIKIIDFGIAQLFLDKNQEGHPVAGKLLYFSPEQLLRKPIDRRVDVYGTGVLLYELVTGERLVQHQATVADTVKLILDMDVEAKVEGQERIHPELRPILIKAMAKDPEQRYAWMEDMTAVLRDMIRKCNLSIDPAPAAAYMKELFQREMAIDRRRMRKLLAEPVKSPTVSSRRKLRKDESPRDPSESLERVSLASWPFQMSAQSPDELSQSGITSICFARGEIIYRQGDPGKDVYVIRSGKVRLLLSLGKMRQTLAVIGEGEFFGENAILEDHHRYSWSQAEEDCELLSMGKETFSELLGIDLTARIAANLMGRLAHTTSLLEASALHDNLSRLIYGLVFFERRKMYRDGKTIDVPAVTEWFQLQEGEDLKKYLAKLRDLNILQFDGTAVVVQNLHKLENILNVLSGRGRLALRL